MFRHLNLTGTIMKLKSFVLTALLAGCAFAGQSASAQANHTMVLVTHDDGAGGFNAHFGDAFGASVLGSSFSDLFTFTVGSSFDSAASLTSSYLRSSTTKDLLITGFSLYKYDPLTMAMLGTPITGINNTAGGPSPTDSWSLSALGLTSGNYVLKVDGQVVGNGGGAFGGDLTISPVPEPATYGMLVAGLGLVGFMARRRKA
jgi:hypothetical protein